MSNYPPYACSCCGITNGDMFSDYFQSLGKKPTEADVAAFEGYRKAWWALKEQRDALERERRQTVMARAGFHKHSDKTRAKISATKLARNKA